MGSTFSIGFIYISERAALQIRSLAQGLYMTSMGLGFTIGTLSGGITAKTWGYSASFYLSSILGLLGLLIILIIWRVDSIEDRVIKKTPTREAMPSLRAVLTDPRILAAGAANFFNSLLFSALIILFPLYGGLIGFDDSQVGFGFTVRGISSTAIRLPTGTATKRLGAIKLMTLGLGISAITVLALPSFDDIMIIGLILGIQGVAYGIYLTAGHAFVAEEAPAAIRGTAIGVYSLFSDISGIISPLILGAIAEIWSLKVAFQIAALICLVGTAIMLMLVRQGETPNSENSSE
jgi:MFS family permease